MRRTNTNSRVPSLMRQSYCLPHFLSLHCGLMTDLNTEMNNRQTWKTSAIKWKVRTFIFSLIYEFFLNKVFYHKHVLSKLKGTFSTQFTWDCSILHETESCAASPGSLHCSGNEQNPPILRTKRISMIRIIHINGIYRTFREVLALHCWENKNAQKHKQLFVWLFCTILRIVVHDWNLWCESKGECQ